MFELFHSDDVFLIPLSILIIYFFASQVRKKYRDNEIKKYFFPALFIRLALTFISAIIVKFYYGVGDTIMYYQAIKDMHSAVLSDVSFLKDIYGHLALDPTNRLFGFFYGDELGFTHYYMLGYSNYIVPRFGLPFSLLFFNSYLCISFFYTLYAFAGSWRLFKTFYLLYPSLKKRAAIAVLFLPSVCFWGAGILKDSLCFGAVGFIVYAFYNIFIAKKKTFISLIILFVNVLLLFWTKPYILLALLPGLFLWVFLLFHNKIRDATLKNLSRVFVIAIVIFFTYRLVDSITTSENLSKFSADNLAFSINAQQRAFELNQGGSNFTLGELKPSFFGIMQLFPLSIATTLFRPFLWEVRSPLMVLGAIESFLFLILTLKVFFRVGIRNFFKYIFNSPFALSFFVFVIIFAGLVGLSTFNFGSLARYKIPCLPFYLMILFIVMEKSGRFSSEYIFSKKLF